MNPSPLLGSLTISHCCLASRATAAGVGFQSLIIASLVASVRAQVGPSICCETTSLGHHCPHHVSLSEMVCGVADSASCSFSPWLLQTDYVHLPFHPQLQHSNGSYIWPGTVVLDHLKLWGQQHQFGVSNGFKFPVWFWVQLLPWPEPWECVVQHQKPVPLHLGRYTTTNPLFQPYNLSSK